MWSSSKRVGDDDGIRMNDDGDRGAFRAKKANEYTFVLWRKYLYIQTYVT